MKIMDLSIMEKKNLFLDFSPLSAEKWQEKALKELKGKPLEDVQWQLQSFYRKEDLVGKTTSPNFIRDDNNWEIGEIIEVEDAKTTNTRALDALANGVNAPCFHWSHSPSTSDLELLLAEIEPAYISTHFNISSGTLPLLKSFYEIQHQQGRDTEQLNGSINGQVENGKARIQLLRFAMERLPRFRVLTIDGKDHFTGSENVVNELTALLTQASDALYETQQAEIAPAELAARMQFRVYIGTSYFVELAKLRALRLLWPLLLQGYGIEAELAAAIEVHFAASTQVEDRELNLIRASTQAMSAVLGGADRLNIIAPDAFSGGADPVARRMARNIQHILQMESYFNRVIDPAAGSYYIEMLTDKIARAAWEGFQQLK